MAIPFSIAVLGGQIVVPTLTGSVKYTVPAGTQSGATFRMREQGVQRLNSQGKGDLLVTVKIDVPKHLNDEQKDLLEKFALAMGENQPRATKKGIFNKK